MKLRGNCAILLYDSSATPVDGRKMSDNLTPGIVMTMK
jgi:hypothetical protein